MIQREKKRSIIIIDTININILPFDNMFDRIISYLLQIFLLHFFFDFHLSSYYHRKISKIKLNLFLKKKEKNAFLKKTVCEINR